MTGAGVFEEESMDAGVGPEETVAVAGALLWWIGGAGRDAGGGGRDVSGAGIAAGPIPGPIAFTSALYIHTSVSMSNRYNDRKHLRS